MTERDKKWNMEYEKLVERKRTNGHCMVPHRCKQDKSLGIWVHTQRKYHKNNKMRPDRKRILDEIGFAWKDDGAHTLKIDEKRWHEKYEKLLEYKRKKGHCLVPRLSSHLGEWVNTQRRNHDKNKMRPDREKLLDKVGFAWKVDTHTLALAARASTTDNSDSEALTSSVGLPNEVPPEESEPPQGQVISKSPSRNRKRSSTCLVETGQVAANANQSGNATGSCSSVEQDGGGRDETDSNPSLVTSSALIGSYPDLDVVQEEATTAPDEIPSGWARVKLEPDC